MLCWCNIIVCVIPILMFARDGFHGLLIIAIINLAANAWAYFTFKRITQLPMT
ncbi:hypothetical protein ACFLZI_04105 [Nitrospirota bacterium]